MGFVDSDVLEEWPDRGEAGIAAPRRVPALLFAGCQEAADQRGVEIAHPQVGRQAAQFARSEPQQEPERITVAGDGIRATGHCH